jgi:phytoene dehydrogenase-like protein
VFVEHSFNMAGQKQLGRAKFIASTMDCGNMKTWDAIVIGGGHNGLVNACYLQRAGLDVVVVEKNDWVGGAATSRELTPGFLYSNCSYVCSLFRPEIMRDLELPRFRSSPMRAARSSPATATISPTTGITMRIAASSRVSRNATPRPMTATPAT